MHEEVKKYFKEIGRKGGKAKNAKMTKKERVLFCSRIGKLGANARWKKKKKVINRKSIDIAVKL